MGILIKGTAQVGLNLKCRKDLYLNPMKNVFSDKFYQMNSSMYSQRSKNGFFGSNGNNNTNFLIKTNKKTSDDGSKIHSGSKSVKVNKKSASQFDGFNNQF